MAELNSNEEQHVLPSKRKQTPLNLDEIDSTKKLRSDADEDKLINDENGSKDEIKDNIEDEEEEEEDYEGEDETDSDDDNEVEHLNGEIDLKGKGIMKDDKGKGKMIEEEDDDDSSDDDESDSDGDLDDDDDLSDDPLTEVDLDNILPSRTRRRTAASGVRISGDENNNNNNNNDDDDDA
ncbi:hypothetical protein QVD17_06802 [Tagetes erecta]|uniref:Uncharacterized protein n=1 Tax=Tagetes erecta TaxID=13708 RepID=A0AAD8LMH6_TARER|nr:hypothetical protein QVD17_06802 [Tagetes erecta]